MYFVFFGFKITAYAKFSMHLCVLKSTCLVCWNETCIFGQSSTKLWFSGSASDKFVIFATNFQIKKCEWTNFLILQAEIYVLVFRRYMFSKRVVSFSWCKKYKSIYYIASIKSRFEFHRIFIRASILHDMKVKG